jgi:hypothetical protein
MVVFLSIQFTISLIGYIKDKAETKTILSLLIILVYLCLELVLDYILKIPFREILVLHIPYIIVFYAAAFSMIGVSFRINRKMGFIVLITFFILIDALFVYILVNQVFDVLVKIDMSVQRRAGQMRIQSVMLPNRSPAQQNLLI